MTSQVEIQVADIEQAALAILEQSSTVHPLLYQWGQYLVVDPSHTAGLTEFYRDHAFDRDEMVAGGWVSERYGEIELAHPEPYHDRAQPGLRAQMFYNECLERLALGLVIYRYDRDAVQLTTRIAEFVQGSQGVWINVVTQMEDMIRELEQESAALTAGLDDENLLTLAQAAEIAKIRPDSLRMAIRRKRIPAIRAATPRGAFWYVTRDDLAHYVSTISRGSNS